MDKNVNICLQLTCTYFFFYCFKKVNNHYIQIAPDPVCKYGLQSYGTGQTFIDTVGRKCMCSQDYKVVCDSKDCKYCNLIS